MDSESPFSPEDNSNNSLQKCFVTVPVALLSRMLRRNMNMPVSSSFLLASFAGTAAQSAENHQEADRELLHLHNGFLKGR